MKSTNWLLGSGSLLCMLGAIALLYSSAATFTAVVLLGILFFATGIVQIIYAIAQRHTDELWPNMALGIMAIASSILIGRNPTENIIGLTLVVGFYLLAGGMVKIVSSLIEKKSGWSFILASGCISVILGSLVLANFPIAAIWTIGTIVGVELIASGVSLISLGVYLKNRPLQYRVRDWEEQKDHSSVRNDDFSPPPL